MSEVLIAGAGPTGLAAALLLHERGVSARVFDVRTEPAGRSKALVVNPRTLRILEGTGVAARIRDTGREVRLMTLRRAGRTLAEIEVAGVDPGRPMTVIPQADTERLLAEALAERGTVVERGVRLVYASQDAAGVDTRLERDGRTEPVRAPLLFAAEGARSATRDALGIKVAGSTLPETWDLADVTYARPAPGPEGYIELAPGGFVFAMAFDEARTRWRYICTYGDVLEHRQADAPPVADTPWRSSFRISHRIADRMAAGRVALGGDAAHLHSPIGARGLNLGVEDACVFAACAVDALRDGTAARIADYGRVRRRADAGVVRRVRLMTEMLRGRGPFGALRAVVPRLAGAVPPLAGALRDVAAGLDHPVRLS